MGSIGVIFFGLYTSNILVNQYIASLISVSHSLISVSHSLISVSHSLISVSHSLLVYCSWGNLPRNSPNLPRNSPNLPITPRNYPVSPLLPEITPYPHWSPRILQNPKSPKGFGEEWGGVQAHWQWGGVGRGYNFEISPPHSTPPLPTPII